MRFPSPGELFARFDLNGDGRLGKDEVPPQLWQWLGRADGDHDGAISREELDAAGKRLRERFKSGHRGPGGPHQRRPRPRGPSTRDNEAPERVGV